MNLKHVAERLRNLERRWYLRERDELNTRRLEVRELREEIERSIPDGEGHPKPTPKPAD